jgi:translation initiation factor IF-2
LQSGGFDVKSHMSVLNDSEIEYLTKKYAASPSIPPQFEHKMEAKGEPTSHKKHTTTPPSPAIKQVEHISEPLQEKGAKQPQAPVSVAPVPEKAKELIVRAMTVAEFAFSADKQVSEVILTLLRQGTIATKNQVLPEKTVNMLALHYGLSVVVPSFSVMPQVAHHAARQRVIEQGSGEERLPIVVVMGHVDHGKTTLLDFIRKTRIAAREKGGITQHIGAYVAQTAAGNIVFLDTPGHEAFTLMRARGIRVADIAVLVIAADDGIMPQTLEAIKQAKSVGLPVIVAINKIDKATPQQIEAVKRGLAQHDLLPEEWGGQTICVAISAKMGTGVAELLEVIILQAQLMELVTDKNIAASGFILESRLEKGLGPVATVICLEGVLALGDYFVSGSLSGKVTSLTDYSGKRIQRGLPSHPLQVGGFSELPHAGDVFQVVTGQEAKRQKSPSSSLSRETSSRQVASGNVLNLIIKTDTASSKEAILGSIAKMKGKSFKELNVFYVGIGPVVESDIMFATDTGSLVYTLHVKSELNATALAHQKEVRIKSFDIIYKLFEDLELLAERGKPIKLVSRKIGEATVLKVFNIKKLGVIAGAHVKSGRFIRDGKVVIWRGKQKVGEGAIKSLERDRKSVKEVHTGFECAFMVADFTEWQPDDRVECYQDVAENA